jgi:hypothetical protein
LRLAKDFVVFLRWRVLPRQSGDDRAVWELLLALPVGVDRDVVAEDGAQIVELARFVRHGDQSPVTVSCGDFDAEDRVDLATGADGVERHESDDARRQRDSGHHGAMFHAMSFHRHRHLVRLYSRFSNEPRLQDAARNKRLTT